MRRAFTLIELLLVVAILSTMVTIGVMGFNASKGSIGMFAAARDTMAMVRRARSVALVTQKPVVVIYSNSTIDDESCAKIEIKSESLFKSKSAVEEVRNLAGEIVVEAAAADDSEGEGETLAEILSPKEIPTSVVKGLKIQVSKEDDAAVFSANEAKRSKISIFSTADSIKRTYEQPSETGGATEAPGDAEAGAVGDDANEPVEVVFNANGTVEPPHTIVIYPEALSPEKGIAIKVDRFGEPKCEDLEGR